MNRFLRLTGLLLLLAFTIAFYLLYIAYNRADRISDILRDADTYAVQGRYDEAITEYETALKIQETQAVRVRLQATRQQQQEEQTALHQISHYVDTGADSLALQMADSLYYESQQARQLYTQLSQQHQDRIALSLFESGLARYEKEDYQAAFDAFAACLRYEPGHQQAHQLFLQSHLMLMEAYLEDNLRKPVEATTQPNRPPELPPVVKTPPPDDLSYQLIDRQVSEETNQALIRTFLISQARYRDNLRKIMNTLFLKDAYQGGFRYHDYATDIEIYVYRSQNAYYNDSSSWVARLIWNRDRDGGKAHFEFK